MNSYQMLSEPIRKFIYDKKWSKFTKIQEAAIPRILTTNNNYILSSKTASGKTEAAFLPILSIVNPDEYGIQILYISPTISLINDQFQRVEELCKYLDFQITKWHSEASNSKKKKIIKNPSGIMLITPESIEAMYVHHSERINELFFDLKFIIIDELHAFLDSDRGLHLKSLLFRIKNNIKKSIRFIGLSATLGDFQISKHYFGEYEKTKVLVDKSKKEIEASIRYFEFEKEDITKDRIFPKNLLIDVFKKTYKNKSLIFPNSRSNVEYLSVKLRKINDKIKGYQNYFSHHSSVSKDIREYIEEFAKLADKENFGICCTSTLELGIDIGSVDLIVQIDSTFSVASLAQRLGRSGRTEYAKGNLLLYSTDKWSFLQSLATFVLLKEGFIEPPSIRNYPIDICFHQILSILKEKFGKSKDSLIKEIKSNYVFKRISEGDIDLLIEDMINKNYIEFVNNELIFGLESEKFVRNWKFYSMFKTHEEYTVFLNDLKIGTLPVINIESFKPEICIYLAAKIWEIVSINHDAKKIYVKKAKKGKPPKFPGGGGNVSKEVRQKMLEILLDKDIIQELDTNSKSILSQFRKEFDSLDIRNLNCERPVIIKDEKIYFYTFASTKINRTLNILFKKYYKNYVYNETQSLFSINYIDFDFNEFIRILLKLLENFKEILHNIEIEYLYLIVGNFCKWGEYLQKELVIKLLIEDYFDIEETSNFLKKIKLKIINYQVMDENIKIL